MDPELKQKRRMLVGTAAVVITTLLVFYFLGTVLLTLGLSLVAAYVLLPVARLMERAMPWRKGRPGLSRGIAVAVIFVAVLGILAGLLALGSTVNLCHDPNNPGAGWFQREGHPQFTPKWTPDGNHIVFSDQSPEASISSSNRWHQG